MKVIFGNNISGALASSVATGATQVEVVQDFYNSLPIFTQGSEFLVLTLSDALNIGANPEFETIKVTAVSSSGGYFLTVSRDYDNDNGGVGGAFNHATATISMRLTAEQLNTLLLKQDDDATPLTAGERLVVSSSGTIAEGPLLLQTSEQNTYTAGGNVFIVFTGRDMITAEANRHQEILTLNGMTLTKDDDYSLGYSGGNTEATFLNSRTLLSGTVLVTRVLSAV
tara:strand:+ start:101 stop:778 length:678 start_codon:yes stop_codon:yes gene_type:complete